MRFVDCCDDDVVITVIFETTGNLGSLCLRVCNNMTGAEWQQQQQSQGWNVGRSSTASSAGGDVATATRGVASHERHPSSMTAAANGVPVSSHADDDAGYSRYEGVNVVSAKKTTSVAAGNSSGVAASSDYDPNYEMISSVVSSKARSDGLNLNQQSSPISHSDLANNQQRHEAWAAATPPGNGHVVNGTGAKDHASRQPVANGDVTGSGAVWLKREPIYQDIDEVQYKHQH